MPFATFSYLLVGIRRAEEPCTERAKSTCDGHVGVCTCLLCTLAGVLSEQASATSKAGEARHSSQYHAWKGTEKICREEWLFDAASVLNVELPANLSYTHGSCGQKPRSSPHALYKITALCTKLYLQQECCSHGRHVDSINKMSAVHVRSHAY